MIRPILAIGHPRLREIAQTIEPDYPNLKELIADMYETMKVANGAGLAAPQVDVSIRLFVVDASGYGDEDPSLLNFRRTYINPSIVAEKGDEITLYEGCLSVPGLNEEVSRPAVITIEYQDEDFVTHKDTVSSMVARIIQHEYDHLNGKIFTDHLSSLRRTLLSKKINAIGRGESPARYRMNYPNKKR